MGLDMSVSKRGDVTIVEIESMDDLRDDPAWAADQERKRIAAIFYWYGITCTCWHPMSSHTPTGCQVPACTCGHKEQTP